MTLSCALNCGWDTCGDSEEEWGIATLHGVADSLKVAMQVHSDLPTAAHKQLVNYVRARLDVVDVASAEAGLHASTTARNTLAWLWNMNQATVSHVATTALIEASVYNTHLARVHVAAALRATQARQ